MEAIVLAAGKGTRMRSRLPKVLHPILNKPLLAYALETLRKIGINCPSIVVGYGANDVCKFLEKNSYRGSIVQQKEQRGTGHAVLVAKKSLSSKNGTVLIWPGDMPLLSYQTLKAFLKKHEKQKSLVSILSCNQESPKGYGRIVRKSGKVTGIKEDIDATFEERKIKEVNTGIYLFDKKFLFDALGKVGKNNKKGEYYLTDVIEILNSKGISINAFMLCSSDEGQGINSRRELALATEIMNKKQIEYHEKRGVSFVSPEQTYVDHGVKIGMDTIIYPWSYIESGVKIGSGCKIGPFAVLRKGTVLGKDSVIGSFVEVTRARIGKKVMAKHLSYLGDTTIGDFTNIGAGTITANFDGKRKSLTRIGKNSYVGSNTVFVAPVKIAEKVKTGAGSIIVRGTKTKPGDVLVGMPAKLLKKKKK